MSLRSLRPTDILSPTVSANPDTASGYAAANANTYWKPYLTWRSNTVISAGDPDNHYLQFDLGSLVEIYNGVVIVDNVNVASIKIQSDDDTGFSGGEFQTETETVDLDPASQRRKIWHQLENHAGVVSPPNPKRYIRIAAATDTTDDGTGKLEIGSVVIALSYRTLTAALTNLSETSRRGMIPNDDFVGGGEEPVITGDIGNDLSLGFHATARSERADVFGLTAASLGKVMVLYRNDPLGSKSEVYIGRPRATAVRTSSAAGSMQAQSYFYREVR